MKLWPLILILLFGCAMPQKPNVIISHAQSKAEPELVLLPKGYHISWPPGDYTNFTVVASESILIPVAQWPVYLQTQTTNFPLVIDSDNKYFAIYGTNLITGESAWAGQQ